MPDSELAHCLVVGLDGPDLSSAEERWLDRYRPAGVILFPRNVTGPEQLVTLCRRLRNCLIPGGEIMADHEGGPISVLATALGRPPAAYGLGVLDDPELTRVVHEETGRLMRRAGLDRVLAPCADVLVEPANPVIGARAFGPDPELVCRHVQAAVTGLRAAGIDSCLKHWPGHGGSIGDSHDEPVAVGQGKLPGPFAAGLAAGGSAVLVGHVADEDSRRRRAGASALPATLDPEAIAAARGLTPALTPTSPPLIFADDVTMGAVQPALTRLGAAGGASAAGGLQDPGQLPRDWFLAFARAGCDRLLCRGIPWRAFPLPDGPSAADPAPAAHSVPDPDTNRSQAGPTQTGPIPAGPIPAPVSYHEARRRLATQTGQPGFPADAGSLFWLDATGGDRWGEASGLVSPLRRRFARITSVTPETSGDPAQRLAGKEPEAQEHAAVLVTAHRPLTEAVLSAAVTRSRMAREGVCVTMGHPAVGTALRRLLPPSWSFLELYDTREEDLQPVLG